MSQSEPVSLWRFTYTSPARWHIAVLLAILMLAGCLRFYRLSRRSFWVDEIKTLVSMHGEGMRGEFSLPHNQILPRPDLLSAKTAKPLWMVLRPDRDDIHPPLYFFLARLWGMFFDWGEAGVRSLSCAASLAAIVFLFLGVTETAGATAGLWAALVMACAQPQIELAQEARAYSLTLALSLAALWLSLRIHRRGVGFRRNASLACCCILAPLTNYFAVTAVAAIAGFCALKMRGRVRRITLACTLGSLLVFLLAWAPVLYAQRHGASGGGTTFFVEASAGHLSRTFWRLLVLPVSFLFTPLPNSFVVATIFAAILFIPLLLLNRRPGMLLWAIWFPLNVAPTLIVDLTHPSWSLELLRYTLLASPAVYAAVAFLATTVRSRRLRCVFPLACAVGGLLHVDQAYNQEGPQRQDWRRFDHEFDSIAKPGDLCIFATGQGPTRFPNELFVCLSEYSGRFPGTVLILHGPPSADLMKAISRFTGAMIVTDYLPPQTIVPGWKTTSGIYVYQGLARFYRVVPNKS